MRRAVNPNHSLRCPTRGHSSCRHCLCAAEGTVLLGPCHIIRIYIHMCLLWQQGQQITMIRGAQELSLPKEDSGGHHVRNQWSRTARSPSTRAPSGDEDGDKDPRGASNSVAPFLLQLPTSSAPSRTSSTSPSQQESFEELSAKPSLPSLPVSSMPFSHPPTPPDHQSQAGSPQSTKMHDNPESWAHGIGREIRESRDSRDTHPWEYPRTTPPQNGSPMPSVGRSTHPSWTVIACPTRPGRGRKRMTTTKPSGHPRRRLYEKILSCSRSQPPKPKHAITIAVSSWALFNMVDGRKIYEEEGLEKYMEYQLNNEKVILTPGPAFHFKALQHISARLCDLYPGEQDLFDIVLMTNNHAQVGVRLINSVNHYGVSTSSSP
ncbi:hypothetical protein MC885_005491 [Smutsia gigantea]|nr:hypothetical protein MC885_005491 [Smutsia gigantea]